MLAAVEGHLLATLGEFARPSGRVAVSFLGAERIEVLRFGPDQSGLVRYATLGMSRVPMADPTAVLIETSSGPRAELVISMRGSQDSVARRLAVLAASPTVEGLVITPGASLDLGEPLWDGAAFRAVLVGEPNGLIADLALGPENEGRDPVRFLPLLPMTANENAYKRVHGAAAIEELWLTHGTDLRDPRRDSVSLT